MRKLFIILLGCVAVLLVGFAGYRSYRVWKNKHLMRLGHAFLEKSDERNAVLAVQEVLRSDPNNLDATRVMAQLTDASHSSSALLWRSRVVELDPHSVADRLAFAQTALGQRDYASATHTLEGMDPAGKETAAYHNIAGAVAAGANHPAEAEMHFIEASRLEPHNPAPQLNLAVVRLHGTNSTGLADARLTLQRLAANPTNAALRCEALRELTLDAMGHKDQQTALALSKQLMQETNSSFQDRLLRLEVLLDTKNTEFKPALLTYQKEAAINSGKVYQLATWEMSKLSPKDAVGWLRTLPVSTQTNQPATLLITEGYTSLKDWRTLHVWLEKQRWGELEFIRHAFMSRALRGLDLADTAKTEWSQALNSASGQKRSLITLLGLSSNLENVALSSQKQSLIMLLKLAAQWNWVNEAEDLLWTLFNRYPQEKWPAQALSQVLFSSGQTRSLMQLFKEESQRSPANLAAKNNLAVIALLLNAKELKPNDLALEVYRQAPTNSSFISTYGYSLYAQGRSAEALKVMGKLNSRDLNVPSIAGYYGLILKATGNKNDARLYLEKAGKGALLPEERALFAQAKAGI